MQFKESMLDKLPENDYQINKANKIRHYLLSMIKEELSTKKINRISFFISQTQNIEQPIKIASKIFNDESDDNSIDDDDNSSNDISCEEEEIFNIKK